MTLNTSEVLDLSKENVQPLRQGRKAAQLKTALQAQTDPDVQNRLHKQREKFEYMIRMYEGDDPLEPYFAYAAWLEQSFTKLGRESNLIPLLEDALLKFKDCDKYRQDQRFVQLLIKYINAQTNPLELYQMSYNQGLGTMCSALYKAWAEELDRCNDFKRADQIYQLGLQCRAQPIEDLQNAHIQFQLSIARKMLEGNINNNTEQNTENSRAALGKLPSKVKSSRISKDTAGIFQLTSRNGDSKNNAIAPGKFKVYQEDETDGILKSDFKNKSEKLPKGSIAERENIMKAGKWAGQKQKQSGVFKSSMPTTPSFQIHEDPDAACENVKTVIRPRALKMRREEFKCPVAVFEDPDPTKKPMYPKHLVYVGGRDMQLEELRAAMYWKKIEKERLQSDVTTPMKCPNEVPSRQSDAKIGDKSEQSYSSHETHENEPINLSDKRAEFRTENLHSSSETEQKNVSNDVKNYQVENLPADQTYKKSETKTEQSHSIHETSQRNVSAEVDPLVGLFDKGGSVPHYSPSTSFTVNTKAAMNVVQAMWASPLPTSTAKCQKASSDFDDSVFKVPSRSPPVSRSAHKKLTFPVFCDDEPKPARKSEKCAFPVYCDETPVASTQKFQISPLDKLSFPIFTDEMLATSTQKPESSKVSSATKLSFPVFSDDIPATSTQKPDNSKMKSGKLSFPVFTDEMVSTSAQSASKPTSGKLSFPVYSDEPIKPESMKSTADKFSFPVFTDDVPATSTQKPESLRNPANKLAFPVFTDDVPPIAHQPESSKNPANKLAFPIFTDDGVMPLMGTKCDSNRNQFDVNKLLFPVDKDDEIPSSSVKSTEICTPVQADKYSIPLIVPVNLADTPLEPENKENLPPKSYATPIERRPLSGILTPATNVPSKPLDSEDDEDDEEYCKLIPRSNDFDEETCSTKAFAITLPSSTPFGRSRQTSPRKSLLYNGSYICEDTSSNSNTVKSNTEGSKYVNGQHLSLILENSKEQGSNSSGGSSAINK